MKKVRLITLLGFCLMLLISFGCVKAFRYSIGCAQIEADQKFSFFIISDIHHLSKSLYDNGKAFEDFYMSGDGKLLQYSDELIDAVTQDINTAHPDFLIVAGDMTCNGEKESHLEMVKKLETVEDMGTCVFVIPGNHDIQNPRARKYIGSEVINTDFITVEEYLNLYAPFGYDGSVSRDPSSLSYLVMATEDTWFLMLDSADYKRNIEKQYPEQGGALLNQTLKWVEQCAGLAKEKDARLIAVMHHSLIDHSKLVNVGYTISNSAEVLKLFHRCGIEIVLTGHIHLQDIKTDQKEGQKVYDIATSCLAVYPHQYAIMDFTPQKGFDYHTVMLDMSSWAEQRKITDETLLDFKVYSADIFTKQCCKKHNNCLSKLNELSEEDREKVSRVLGEMNLMYFSGYRNEAFDEIVKTEGFRILENMPACYTKEYAMSMLNDERSDNNMLSIPILPDE